MNGHEHSSALKLTSAAASHGRRSQLNAVFGKT